MLLLLLKLTLPSIRSRLRGGGLSSITSCQPKGMVTLLPATGLPPVVLALQKEAGQQVGTQHSFLQEVSLCRCMSTKHSRSMHSRTMIGHCPPCSVVRPQQSAIPAELQQ